MDDLRGLVGLLEKEKGMEQSPTKGVSHPFLLLFFSEPADTLAGLAPCSSRPQPAEARKSSSTETSKPGSKRDCARLPWPRAHD